MTTISDQSHKHLSAFVNWIRPEATTRTEILRQAPEIRSRIKARAEEDGLTVRSMPNSGSFAKATGLRRHMRGGLEIEGQDVDLPFVLNATTDEGDRISELLRRFDRYAAASYPDTKRRITGSSVELQFSATKLNYDLVPMLATRKPNYQTILKSDGTRRLTSVSKHIEFVTRRTASSEKQAGRVKFNECVRLLKWWRYIRINDKSLSIEKVRTMLIELMCAAAYDRDGVKETYTDTLHMWFAWLAHVSAKRLRIEFSDFPTIETNQPASASNPLWQVLDPVNKTNNVVPNEWGKIALDEFAEWFGQTRDDLGRLISLEAAGRKSEADAVLAEIFGPAVLTHGAA